MNSSSNTGIRFSGNSQLLVCTWLIKLVSLVSLLLLMMTSYRLWLPSSKISFPQIPALEVLQSVPYWIDYVGLLGLLSLQVVQFITIVRQYHGSKRSFRSEEIAEGKTRLERSLWWMLIAVCLCLVSLNQHRLQSWIYHFLVFSLIFTIRSAEYQLVWLKRVVVSVYIYSAIGKFDFEFAHTVGQDFLNALGRLLHFSVENWSENDRLATALLFPLIELAIGVGLLIGRVCRCVGVAACLFHLLLAALVIGPLQHSWGVLLWNLQFATQAIVLFVLPKQPLPLVRSLTSQTSMPGSIRIGRQSPRLDWTLRFVVALLVAVLVLPVTERAGYWDHWPSWALYAPHSSRVRVTVARFAVHQLPRSMTDLLGEDDLEQSEVELPLARWSFRQLGVPIYPQARFQLGVARGLAKQMESEFAIQVEVRSAADRFTGERQSTKLQGVREICGQRDRFWLGSRPRD